ncbi:hypothetical protein OA193_00370 [Prochlorococcus sp. AH-716-O22]|nr:hypothetical protein [Prochlorococcus sp. AH-716-O22]
MDIKKIKVLLCSSISVFCIVGIQNTNASMKDQYKSQSQCSYEAATYEDSKYRYCVNKKTKRITSYENSRDKGYVEKGFLGSSEMTDQMDMYSQQFYYILYEWSIDGNKLVQYGCKTTDGINCSGKVIKYEEAKKKNK